MTDRSARRRRWIVAAVSGAFVAWFGGGLLGAYLLTAPVTSAVVPTAILAGCTVEDVATITDDGLTVRGWLVRARPDSRDCVVLAAGIRGNRQSMRGRAEWYLAHGWSALLVDLRGTGVSDAVPISFGRHESGDLHAWRTFLRQRSFDRIGAHGQSLGAAAIVYGDGAFDFCVLESCYTDIDEALRARLSFVPWPGLLLWPLRLGCSWRLGLDAASLRPIERIASLRAPTLILDGELDTKVGDDAGRRLFDACAAASKHLVTIRGAAHVDLFGADLVTCSAALAAFVPPASVR